MFLSKNIRYFGRTNLKSTVGTTNSNFLVPRTNLKQSVCKQLKIIFSYKTNLKSLFLDQQT